MFLYTAIEIVSENLSVGENGSLSCKSIIDVEVMEWLNSNGEVIASLTDARRLNLTFAPVNTSINNQMYTCRVNHRASVNKTITVSVAGKITIIIIIIESFYKIKSGRSFGSDDWWPQQCGSHWRGSHYQLHCHNHSWCVSVANFNSHTSKWNKSQQN